MRSHLQGTQTRRLTVAIATVAAAAILLAGFAAIFHARQRHASKIATRYHSDQPVIGARNHSSTRLPLFGTPRRGL